jgi:iron(III) transport system permease protein
VTERSVAASAVGRSGRRGPSRRHGPGPLTLTGLVIAIALLLPLVFLLMSARQAGWSEVRRLLLRRLTLDLLVNTVSLTVLVTLAAAVIATAAAWCVERTLLPGRRIWPILLVLPVAFPDFVVGYAWHSFAPNFIGLPAAALVMTLVVYPLVYLPVTAALRRTDPALEEIARSLGCSRLTTFRRVIVPQIRPAVLGGCLVVTLVLLAEFGAFEILSFQTFTTAIFGEFKVDAPAASAMSLVLVLLGMLVLGGDVLASGHARLSRTGSQTARRPTRYALGRMTLPTLAGLSTLVVLAVGIPVGTLAYWMTQSQQSTLPATGSLLAAALSTARYSGAAALVATTAALPVAVLAVHHRSVTSMAIERSTYLIQSLPGVVIALSLVFFAIRWASAVYQTGWLLIAAYALMFFPLALVCLRTSVAQAPPRLGEVGRSLGRSPFVVLARVTLPLVSPGLLAGFCLVFLSAVTELTATLVLIPTGKQTLATQFWAYESNTSYGAAAPYAAVIVAVAALPSVLLALWFTRLPGGTAPVAQNDSSAPEPASNPVPAL